MRSVSVPRNVRSLSPRYPGLREDLVSWSGGLSAREGR